VSVGTLGIAFAIHACSSPDSRLADDLARASVSISPESARANAKRDSAALHVLRVTYAKDLENTFLDAGLDVRVSCRGTVHTVLRLEYVLAGRVFVRQIDKSDLVANAMKLGFKRVEILSSDGVIAHWTF
jgi:hypothetical protein